MLSSLNFLSITTSSIASRRMAITMPNAMAHTMSTVLTARTMPTCM